MKIIHVCDGWETWNGAANIARLIANEQTAAGETVVLRRWASVRELRAADEVWVHCGWKPCLWWAVLWGRRVKWMPEACYDPIRLGYHAWKKWPVGFVERFFLRRCAALVATCPAEADWIRTYVGKACPPVEVTDIRRFFAVGRGENQASPDLHILYLGRRHPLKGVGYLERAVGDLNCRSSTSTLNFDFSLRIVSDHHGEELERDWAWCDVLCLPTLSDNFGLVVAEALARGKRVIVTDGAPAWDPANASNPPPDSRLVYLRGYRDGSDETRIRLLRDALERSGRNTQ